MTLGDDELYNPGLERLLGLWNRTEAFSPEARAGASVVWCRVFCAKKSAIRRVVHTPLHHNQWGRGAEFSEIAKKKIGITIREGIGSFAGVLSSPKSPKW